MASLWKVLDSNRRVDALLLILLGGLWVWKAVETAGRETHLLRRNLGWGYVVDLGIPLGFTGAVGLFFLLRRIARRPH
jgi:hypothetical protein